MTEGTLSKWCVAAGDEITFGTVLAEIETDKCLYEWQALVTATVLTLLVEEGEAVAVGQAVALVEAR